MTNVKKVTMYEANNGKVFAFENDALKENILGEICNNLNECDFIRSSVDTTDLSDYVLGVFSKIGELTSQLKNL